MIQGLNITVQENLATLLIAHALCEKTTHCQLFTTNAGILS